jgi:hypothetical protein
MMAGLRIGAATWNLMASYKQQSRTSASPGTLTPRK